MRTLSRMWMTSFLLAAGPFACITPEAAYSQAEKQNTEAAYRDFIAAHPKSRYASSARERLDELAYEKARRKGTIEGYWAYLRKHRQGRAAPEARTAIARLEDQRDFEQAIEMVEKEGTTKGLEAYLRQHPDGTHSEEAKKILEERAWERAKSAGTIKAYGSFVWSYPRSRFREEAFSQVADLRYAQALKEQTPEALDEYLRAHSEEERADDVQAFRDALRAGSPQAFRDYIERFPNGKFRQTAENRREAEYYEAIKHGARTVEPCRSYLKLVPEGELAAEASECVDWFEAELDGSKKAIKKYLATHPEGAYAARARRYIEAPPASRFREYEKACKQALRYRGPVLSVSESTDQSGVTSRGWGFPDSYPLDSLEISRLPESRRTANLSSIRCVVEEGVSIDMRPVYLSGRHVRIVRDSVVTVVERGSTYERRRGRWRAVVEVWFKEVSESRERKERAVKYARLNRDCEKGRARACFDLAGLIEGDDPTAEARIISLYERACRKRVAESCFTLANLRRDKNDGEGALKLDRLACQLNHAAGCYNTASSFEDAAKSCKYYRKACKLGLHEGCSVARGACQGKE